MEPMSARASLTYQIRKAGLEDIVRAIRVYEKSLPPGRYLQGSELCQYLRRIGANPKNRIEINNPSENDVAMLDAMWKQYERDVIWAGEKFEEEHPEIELEAQATWQRVHTWEDRACEKLGMKFINVQ